MLDNGYKRNKKHYIESDTKSVIRYRVQIEVKIPEKTF